MNSLIATTVTQLLENWIAREKAFHKRPDAGQIEMKQQQLLTALITKCKVVPTQINPEGK